MNQKLLIIFYLTLAVLTITVVSAVPSGPTTDINPIKSERWSIWAPKTVAAEAGNVTEFNTDGSTITRTWQGYFGNITGKITLGDSVNNTLYDWNLASPQGEIYAVRNAAVPAWTSVVCASQAELQAEDLALGANESIDEDSVNRTFVVGGAPDQLARYAGSDFSHPLFYVENQTIVENSCPVATMYNSSSMPSPYFKEVMLSDGSANMIYTAIIAHTLNPFAESDGFDQRTHDFEMIVGENGHGNDIGPSSIISTYWFYLELE